MALEDHSLNIARQCMTSSVVFFNGGVLDYK